MGATAALTLAIPPLNLNWRAAIRRYKAGINVRKEYREEIDMEFCERRGREGWDRRDQREGWDRRDQRRHRRDQRRHRGHRGHGGRCCRPAGQAPAGAVPQDPGHPVFKTHGNSELEVRLATYFLVLSPLITLLVARLTGLVTLQILPRFAL